ncbi:ADYC domain-containing protein [Stigmatella sp. ncwal1]|uniref:ADYC domain-containing protein n=1 Tax=Stigmatella ashevillensis TaxID=2995309 RepID=A0ABT5DJM4_9BACT|nr:ADYC domain-containing protein [Stigmatella ashevillena]MDC0712547.1 ADYC domain-containing protein [Stigmatella ashevillena]
MNRKDTRHWQNRALLTAVWGLLAAAPPALGEGKIPDQGRLLHGTARGRLERPNIALSTASLASGALPGVSIDRGQLRQVSSGMAGSAFVNVSFTHTLANELVTFRITGAQPHINRYAGPSASPSATVWEYKVEYSSPSLGTGALCPGGPEDQWALALPGLWNGSTLSVNNSVTFAFACLPRVEAPTLGGVAAKCVELGYPPWQSNDPRIDGTALSLSHQDALRHHVTCTSMASADYCGEATPNTLSGTPITLYHSGNVPAQTDASGQVRVAGGPVREDYFFEAAWALVDTATQQPITSSTLPSRVRAQAMCLTKKRWSTLPLRGTCIADHDESELTHRLADPRNPDAPSAKYCEDYTRDELIQQGAVLFSYSKFLDAALYRFQHITTGAYLTTSKIIISPQDHPLTTIYLPDPSVFLDSANYRLADDGLDDSYEGPLFKLETPSHLFEGVTVSPLQRFRDTDIPRKFITLVGSSGVSTPAGYAMHEVEGYVYADAVPPPSGPSLRLYKSVGSNRYLTTTHEEFVPSAPLTYTPLTVTPMGYLPRLEYYAAPRPY